jgi:hypothetical protein
MARCKALENAANGPEPANLPWDSVGPSVRFQVVQAGEGGPFVMRSNPIGGIVDAIRGFCFPTPMVEDGNGGYDSELGLGSPQTESEWGIFQGGGGLPFLPSVGAGISTMMPDPPPANNMVADCGPAALYEMNRKLTMAGQRCDIPGAQMVKSAAAACAANAPVAIKPGWVQLSARADRVITSLENRCNQATAAPAPRKRKQTSFAGYRLSSTPNHQSMTEGNVRGQPTYSPMNGMVDPGFVERPGDYW